EAEAWMLKAIDVLREVGDRRTEGLFLGALGGVRAAQGDGSRALEALDAADRLLGLSVDGLYTAAVDLHRGHVDLLRARESAFLGNGAAAEASADSARARCDRAKTRAAPLRDRPA